MAPELRPASMPKLGLWWLVAAGIVGGLLFAATDHLLRAGVLLSLSLLGWAGLRAILPEDRAGGLVVRSRLFDVCALVVLAVGLAAITLSLDLHRRA